MSPQLVDFDNEESEHFFDFLVRRESFGPVPQDEIGRKASNFTLSFIILACGTAFLALVGAITVFRWILP